MPPTKPGRQTVPEALRPHVAREPVLHVGLTSKFLWVGGPDTGKTTHAKQTVLRYPRAAVWDPGHEWDVSFCRRYGFLVARDMAGLEAAARRSSRVVLQPPRAPEDAEARDAFEEERRALGDAFAWWCLRNLRGPCMVYLDEPHTMFKKAELPPGLGELLRRGHKEENRLAMGWSAWGARELPNDLENVTHLIVFRPFERNDVTRVDKYFGKGWGALSEMLPDFWHMVKQKNPATRTVERAVFPPIRMG